MRTGEGRVETRSSTMVGSLGSPWRAEVDGGGNVVCADGSPPLQWFVSAEDRWHRPAEEVATRQVALEGTPVIETRIRVPSGDVVQRLFVSPGRGTGPALIMDVENDSARAVVLAVTRRDVVTARPSSSAAADHASDLGLASPPTTLPLAHRSRVRVVLPCEPLGSIDPTDYVTRFGEASDVVRGWMALCDRASRLVLPDVSGATPTADLVVAERCRMALDSPGESDSAVDHLVAWRELVRLGLLRPDLDDVVAAVEILARSVRRVRRLSGDEARAVEAAAFLLVHDRSNIEQRRDPLIELLRVLERALGHAGPSLADLVSSVSDLPSRWIDRTETALASWTGDQEITLVPGGMRPEWLGAPLEAHGLQVGPWHRVSFAVRWHGANAAVIWEVEGPSGLRLRSGADGGWTSTDRQGESLWRLDPATIPAGDFPSFT